MDGPKDPKKDQGEEKDQFHDDNWPIGFDKNGQPNVVAYIPDWEEFLRTHKPRKEPRPR